MFNLRSLSLPAWIEQRAHGSSSSETEMMNSCTNKSKAGQSITIQELHCRHSQLSKSANHDSTALSSKRSKVYHVSNVVEVLVIRNAREILSFISDGSLPSRSFRSVMFVPPPMVYEVIPGRPGCPSLPAAPLRPRGPTGPGSPIGPGCPLCPGSPGVPVDVVRGSLRNPKSRFNSRDHGLYRRRIQALPSVPFRPGRPARPGSPESPSRPGIPSRPGVPGTPSRPG